MSYLVDVTETKASDQAGRRRTKTVTSKELLRDSASLAEKEEESLLKGQLLESTSSPNKSTQNKKDSDEPRAGLQGGTSGATAPGPSPCPSV